MHDEYRVFLGLDVGKEDHHAVALSREGVRLVEQIRAALDVQTVVVAGTTAAETVLPRLTDLLRLLSALADPHSHAYQAPTAHPAAQAA